MKLVLNKFEKSADNLIISENHNHDTPIIFACSNEKWDVVKFIIDYCAEHKIDIGDVQRSHMLQMACIKQNFEAFQSIFDQFKTQKLNLVNIARILIVPRSNSPYPIKSDNSKTTLIHTVCRVGDPKTLELLLQNLKETNIMELKDDNDNTVLHVLGSAEVAELIFKFLKDNKISAVFEKNKSGDSPVFCAVVNGKAGALKVLLREQKFKVTTEKDDRGSNILHMACENGDVKCVEVILQHMESRFEKNNSNTKQKTKVINDKNLIELTPLHLACVKGYGKVVQVVLDEFSDDYKLLTNIIGAENTEGANVLHLVFNNTDKSRAIWNQQYSGYFKHSHHKVRELAFNEKELAVTSVIEALVKAESQSKTEEEKQKISNIINKSDQARNTPLHYAVINGDEESVTKLLKLSRIRTDRKNNDGKTPLLIAIEMNEVKLVELLLKHSTTVDAWALNFDKISEYKEHGSNSEIVKLLKKAWYDEEFVIGAADRENKANFRELAKKEYKKAVKEGKKKSTKKGGD